MKQGLATGIFEASVKYIIFAIVEEESSGQGPNSTERCCLKLPALQLNASIAFVYHAMVPGIPLHQQVSTVSGISSISYLFAATCDPFRPFSRRNWSSFG